MTANNARVVAVTGGASGIGAACVQLFASRGCAVVVLDLLGNGSAPSTASPGSMAFIRTDVANRASVEAAFALIGQSYGRLDVLVNSAGIESKSLLSDMQEEAWDRVQSVNVKGTMLCTQAAARIMRGNRGGAVVNVASIAGKRISYSGDMAYTASKAAVLGFTRHAAFELALDGIRVNAVCPGPTLTPMIERSLDARRIAAVAQIVPLGRWVQAADVANAVEFFAGDASAMCTGTSLDIDGGVLVSNGSPYQDYFAARQPATASPGDSP